MTLICIVVHFSRRCLNLQNILLVMVESKRRCLISFVIISMKWTILLVIVGWSSIVTFLACSPDSINVEFGFLRVWILHEKIEHELILLEAELILFKKIVLILSMAVLWAATAYRLRAS